jgi:hypothetical protein
LDQLGVCEAFGDRIGLHLAKGEWEAAAKLIMAPREGERDPLPEARLLFQAGDVGAARNFCFWYYRLCAFDMHTEAIIALGRVAVAITILLAAHACEVEVKCR